MSVRAVIFNDMTATTQQALIRAMTPYRRLEIAQELYQTAWAIKAAGLRTQFPEVNEIEIHEGVRRIFQTGYAGAGRDYFATRKG